MLCPLGVTTGVPQAAALQGRNQEPSLHKPVLTWALWGSSCSQDTAQGSPKEFTSFFAVTQAPLAWFGLFSPTEGEREGFTVGKSLQYS